MESGQNGANGLVVTNHVTLGRSEDGGTVQTLHLFMVAAYVMVLVAKDGLAMLKNVLVCPFRRFLSILQLQKSRIICVIYVVLMIIYC